MINTGVSCLDITYYQRDFILVVGKQLSYVAYVTMSWKSVFPKRKNCQTNSIMT